MHGTAWCESHVHPEPHSRGHEMGQCHPDSQATPTEEKPSKMLKRYFLLEHATLPAFQTDFQWHAMKTVDRSWRLLRSHWRDKRNSNWACKGRKTHQQTVAGPGPQALVLPDVTQVRLHHELGWTKRSHGVAACFWAQGPCSEGHLRLQVATNVTS